MTRLADRLVEAADPRTPVPDGRAATARWDAITATVIANPVVLLPKLAAQLSGAWGQLVADNSDLVNPAVLLRYVDTIAAHNGYATNGQLGTGVAWMVALAHDLAGR